MVAASSPAKLDGLTRFFRKHGLRFDAATRTEAEVRAAGRFGWTPPLQLRIPRLDDPNVRWVMRRHMVYGDYR
jgi:hypothetical protein